jgi:DNA sulfur modification protein DndB
MPELARRVSFADDIHSNAELSSWIQRSLKGGRAEDIAGYLRSQPERFFSSLVIALYGGTPQWVPLKVPSTSKGGPELGDAADVLGVLQLGGKESLFAVDGQHRLAGMKRFLESRQKNQTGGAGGSAGEDLVSVLVVAHRVDRKERTRRLFTTLNKTAVPVSKMERIALDENDVMAIVVRRLVEDHDWFRSPRIAMHHTNNLGREEEVALTTIGNLYDVLRALFLATSKGKSKKDLEYIRPSDRELDAFYEAASSFFKSLSEVETGLSAYFESENPREVCAQFRTPEGGSVYFRPMGLALMSDVAIRLRDAKGDHWQDWLAALPKRLDQAPFAGTMWSHRGTIEPKHRVLCRDLLLYMCGIGGASSDVLRERLRRVSGDSDASLPRRVRV